MNWNFSLGWFIGGLAIFIAGGLMIVYYRQISDNFVHGVSTYDKVKFWGIIVTIIGFLVMANLHTFVLELLVSIIFPGR